MKPQPRLLTALWLVAVAVTALPASAKLPPLLDRELFFGNPEIAGAQLSPDGRYMAFLKPWKDTRNIWVKGTFEPFSAARLLTAETKRPIPGFFWSQDSRFILFVKDNDGDENFNVWAVFPADRPAPGEPAPQARNLTDLKGVRALIYDVPKKHPDIIWVGLNDRDASWHDLYRVRISTGEKELVYKNTDRITGWEFDLDGQPRLAQRVLPNGDTEILAWENGTFRKVYGCSVLETCTTLRFAKDGQKVYLLTNRGEDVNFAQLALLDLVTGHVEKLEEDPLARVDLTAAIFSERTDELVGTVYLEDRPRVYWRDPAWAEMYRFLQRRLPGRLLNYSSITRDEKLLLITATADTEPGETYLFDREKKKLIFQYRVRERLPRKYLASVQPIRYPSSDGLEIPAYLTLPKGIPAKNLPLVVVPHGGPWARDFWGYSGLAQFLANRGYAVLQPNFRGSTGYGKAFLNAGNRQWGEKMQDDITWGVKYLVERGIADPKRVGIMGGSYGGYATLAGVTFTPDLYAAAVDIVGPSNLITLLQSIPPYWEAVRAIFHFRMGDPSTPEGKAQLERQSPLNYVDRIKTPLMVVQGANDPRVKKSESDQIVVALRDKGFPVEYLLADDEGHGFARPVNNMAMYAAVEKFLAKHLGGRYQADMPPDVAKRLAEITVDVSKVEKPKRITVEEKPIQTLTLQPGTWQYRISVHAQGQTQTFESQLSVREENDLWVVTETLRTPQGEAKDTVKLAKGSLTLRSRQFLQGPVTLTAEQGEGKVTAAMVVGGQTRTFDIATPGPIWGEGPALIPSLAALPLAPNLSHTFYRLDLMRQQALPCKLLVVGEEQVEHQGQTVACWKVNTTCGEDDERSTHWVAKEGRQVVKGSGTSNRMPGATLGRELMAGP
ncbi:MAG: S9 family peptidase [Thermoanaerobaculum sp.]|nr:S9 family peptidase [Thermoanaerobaculum sp.]MDW7968387.1 S9 family peptidase [Thermoanaerobaculum sp.]